MKHRLCCLGTELLGGILLLGLGCTKAEIEFHPFDAAGRPGDVPSSGPDAARETDASNRDLPPDLPTNCPAPRQPGCEPISTGICDPVCQEGTCEWCTQQCSFQAGADGKAPEAVCVGKGDTSSGSFPTPCQVPSAGFSGTVRPSDGCPPGSICLAPTDASDTAYCFKLCRNETHCLSYASCGPRKTNATDSAIWVCDPPADRCGPDGNCCDPLSQVGCDKSRFCYLATTPDLGTGHSRAFCDFTAGEAGAGASCAVARDCSLRQTCVNGKCRQVVRAGDPCPGNGSAFPLGSEFGWCL